MVRCLGPGKDHYFASDDPVRHRICGRCAKAMEKLRVTAMYHNPLE